MRGTVSFHPVDTAFFDELLNPLLEGKKVNPEEYVKRAIRVQAVSWSCAPYLRCLEYYLELLAPPPPPTEGKLWERFKARLERFDYRPDPTSLLVSRHIEPELHLRGRPFLITEGSADRVASAIDDYCGAPSDGATRDIIEDQLIKLDKQLTSVEPEEVASAPSVTMRRELLDGLKRLYELALAARRGEKWGSDRKSREPAAEVLERELPWRAVVMASRAMPFWMARDVDGLETICAAAGVPPPTFVTPAYRLFGELCETYPKMAEGLGTELSGPRSVGGWVAPDDVPELLEFLNQHGSTIIQCATRAGEGTACAMLLRKIRECAKYAEAHKLGYLEASGVPGLGPGSEGDGPAL